MQAKLLALVLKIREAHQTYVGNHAEVGNFVEVKNSNIKNNVKVKHLSYIGDCQIGSHCNIRSFSFWRKSPYKKKPHTNFGC